MTLKGFVFLLAVTMAAVALGALVGDRVAAPGFERTMVVAVVAAPIVLLAGRYAERRGWVGGSFDLDRARRGATGSAGPSSPSSPAERAPAAPAADDRSPGDSK